MSFKVEYRTECAICFSPVPKGFRSYCSRKCRNKSLQLRWQDYRSKYQKDSRNKKASIPDPDKLQCLICGLYYVQVASHVLQVHKITAQQYKEDFELPISRGVIPKWYKKLKGDIALHNKTYKNLEAGKENRYKPHDPKAILVTGLKGKYGSNGFKGY